MKSERKFVQGEKFYTLTFDLVERVKFSKKKPKAKKNSLVQRHRRARFQLAVYQPATGDFGYIEIIYMLMVGHFFHT